LRTLLLDADVLAYQVSQFHEVATEVEPGYWTWFCDFNKVIESIDWQISAYLKRLEADKFILCLTDYESNFRKEVLSTYKSRRGNIKKPLVLKPTREFLIKEHNALIYPSLEGDDIMGILSTEPHEDERIIVSIDKDMKTIPGKYYNPNTDIVLDITEDEANYWHFYQTLVGDTIDGYSGLYGVGPVAAKKILDKGVTWKNVVKAYIKADLEEEDALVQARCARILRASDYNQETKEPILWTPIVEVK
jgi:DNA polymerase-1